MGRFDGQVALVSGGARGMGESHVRGLVAEGAQVVIGDVLDGEGESLARELGPAATYVHLDVTQKSDWLGAVHVAQGLGGLHVLVNNAGVVVVGPLLAADEDAYRKVVDVNQVGVWLGMAVGGQAIVASGGGAIVNISSTAGLQGYAAISGYVSSKWAVRGMTKAAALELGRDGVRVNSVHPGPILTPMTQDMDDNLTAFQPIPRMGRPEEVTRAVLFLASAEASYITGAELAVDGGNTLGPLTPIG